MIRNEYTVTLYVSLEPIVHPSHFHMPDGNRIAIHAIVMPDLITDVIIGNRSIHDWDLYPWIRAANDQTFAPIQRPQSALARLLARPIELDSDRDDYSVQSAAADLDFRVVDSLDDRSIDDFPPDAFPDLPSDVDEDTVTVFRDLSYASDGGSSYPSLASDSTVGTRAPRQTGA